MLTDRKNELAGLVCLYPMIYCFAGVLLTRLLRKPISQWFEVILYLDENELEEERRMRDISNGTADMRELTLNDEEDDAAA